MFGNVVLNVDHDEFEHLLEEKKKSKGVTLDTELEADDLKALDQTHPCLLYTSPSPRDRQKSRMPSSA